MFDLNKQNVGGADVYGLLPDDSTIQYFADTNNIGLNEVFQIEKGRKIVYYV